MSLETNVWGTGHLISGRQLAIPDYQRSYSWADAEINDLWTDLEGAIEKQVEEYFLGSIVTTQSTTGRMQVIDGQQRLATVTLMYFGEHGRGDKLTVLAATVSRPLHPSGRESAWSCAGAGG